MPLSPEQLTYLATLRQKVADNTITLEELKKGIQICREDRVAARSHQSSKASARGPTRSADDILAGLDSL